MATKKQTTSEATITSEQSTASHSTSGRSGNTAPTQQSKAQEPTSRSAAATTPTSDSSGAGSGAGVAAATSLYDQAKETAGQAYEVAAEKAVTKLEEQKVSFSGGLASIAGSVRQVGDNLRGPDVQDGISKFAAEYSETAAKKIEGVANYFEKKNVREMYGDFENFARRNPAAFLGGAFVLGLLAARLLKSGSPSMNTGTGRQERSEGVRSYAAAENE